MHAKFIVSLFLVLSFTWTAQASECLLNMALKDPNLSSNADFWAEYGKLAEKGKVSDEDMKELVGRYGGGKTANSSNASSSTPPSTSFQPSLKIEVQNSALKDIKKLPRELQKKVDEFIEIASKPGGMQEIRSNPGRWDLERIAGAKDKASTVRINKGFRILFTQIDDRIDIIRVNDDQVHRSATAIVKTRSSK